ncbi:uncharacterized protein LOC119078594 [Bradysia coprophila]|uniref:uncharacterized protein LOC119078594 n=1 Tax=Bradysia coprophila TaxID=38358 RepID=UPI00187D87AF|nr:uncharacterized protein LOC119078594 [Bradysia coprophila]
MHVVGNVVEVVDRFISLESIRLDSNGLLGPPSYLGTIQGLPQNDVAIIISAQMFRLTNTGKKIAPTATDTEETEGTLAHDLKNMFVAHENYADLKLESKDNMTLDAHKFILASRSPYMRKCIDDAMKTENFNGTIKMNMNGKPLVTILHWMYTAELHENASNVMEEVVDAAVLFELTQLMKLLDRKVITICNKDNMFRLYQVAQKNGMPNAMDDISAYIRANL